jgi:O-methyltransferase
MQGAGHRVGVVKVESIASLRNKGATGGSGEVLETGQWSEGRLKTAIQSALNRRGYQISKIHPKDFDEEIISLIERVQPYTMTSPERIVATVNATEYVVRHKIPGALVECGVWRGGSAMAMALTLMRLGETDRDIYLYDTFEGMPTPTELDVTTQGLDAAPIWEANKVGDDSNVWCRATIDQVRDAVQTTRYPAERFHLIKGMVEDTLPAQPPGDIALLRLDTDFYESTRAELNHLYPLLAVGGPLIFDDYGEWEGARKAADEYFEENGIRILLDRTDSTGRTGVKQSQ